MAKYLLAVVLVPLGGVLVRDAVALWPREDRTGPARWNRMVSVQRMLLGAGCLALAAVSVLIGT